MVKTLNRNQLSVWADTPWRQHLGLGDSRLPGGPCTPPLMKRYADLKWRIPHGPVVVNSFISIIKEDVEDKCPFCTQRETERVSATVWTICVFTAFNEVFTKKVFIRGFKYTRQRKQKSQLLNFILGEAKMAVFLTRRRKIDGGETTSPFW